MLGGLNSPFAGYTGSLRSQSEQLNQVPGAKWDELQISEPQHLAREALK